jgi:16S rRNA (cytosine967-C5)-methyltransferase
LSPRSLYISGYNYLSGIDAFNDGYFFVQDESSMCAVMAAGIKENDIVLDVCAAPGGKTMYAAGELNKTGLVSARDISYYKVQKIEDNIRRCNLDNVETKVQDALILDNEYVGKADVVIADLPCSGLGVIGTKPDIKYKITEEQIDELKNLQRNILDVCCRYLKKGGILIFSTCTINKGENYDNAMYLNSKEDIELVGFEKLLPEIMNGMGAEKGFLQILPDEFNTSGFFISKFVKK